VPTPGVLHAAFVGLGEAVVLCLTMEGEQAVALLPISGISRLASITLKKNFVGVKGVEFRFDTDDPDASMDSAEPFKPHGHAVTRSIPPVDWAVGGQYVVTHPGSGWRREIHAGLRGDR
jgi:hypothetical protein